MKIEDNTYFSELVRDDGSVINSGDMTHAEVQEALGRVQAKLVALGTSPDKAMQDLFLYGRVAIKAKGGFLKVTLTKGFHLVDMGELA